MLRLEKWRNAGTSWYRRSYEGYVKTSSHSQHFYAWSSKGMNRKLVKRLTKIAKGK